MLVPGRRKGTSEMSVFFLLFALLGSYLNEKKTQIFLKILSEAQLGAVLSLLLGVRICAFKHLFPALTLTITFQH